MQNRRLFSVHACILMLLLVKLLFPGPVLSQIKDAEQCRSAALRVRLDDGRSFQRSIGNLTLRIDAVKGNKNNDMGWTYSLVDRPGRDYIAPVNLPLRFNPLQILGPGYSLTARESLSWNRNARFLLSESDYEKIDPLWKQAMWPADSPDPPNAAGNYLDALKKLRGGYLRLSVLDCEISSDDVVQWVILQIQFTVPGDFYLDPALKPETAACEGYMTLQPAESPSTPEK